MCTAALAAVVLVAAFSGTGQGLDRKVTWHIKATPAGTALESLSGLAGVTLTVEARLAREVILADVKETPLSTLMDKLAHALYGEWEKTETGYRLFRSAVKQRELEKAYYDRQVKRLEKLLEKKANGLALAGTPEARADAFVKALETLEKQAEEASLGIRPGLSLDGPRLESPAGRLMYELLIGVGAKELASVPLFSTVVYSNLPTPAQRPLGPAAQAAIAEYQETESLLAGQKLDMPFSGLHEDIVKAASMPGGVRKVLFGVRAHGRTLSFWVNVYTKEGRRRSWASTSTYNLGDNPYAEEAAAKAPKGATVSLSQASSELDRLIWRDPSRGAGLEEKPASDIAVSKATVEAILNPEKSDPLSFSVSEALLSLAENKSVPVVACVPDGLVRSAKLATANGKINLDKFAALAKIHGAEIETRDGWLLVKATNPTVTERMRLPRAALGRFMRAAKAARAVDLKTYARYHLEGGFALNGNTINRTYRVMLEALKVAPLFQAESHAHTFYALIGSLSISEWAMLERGREIGMMGSQARRDLLAAYVSHVAIEAEDGSGAPELDLEPTEILTAGLWPLTTLRLTRNEESVFSVGIKAAWPGAKKAFVFFGWSAAEEVAESYKRSGPGVTLEQALGKQPILTGKRSTQTFVFRIAPNRITEEDVRSLRAQAESAARPFAELPDELKRELQEAFAKGGG